MIVLEDRRARAEVHPEAGAAIGRYDLTAPGGEAQPIFQTSPSTLRQGPFALGQNLLVPFSNRISGGGFSHGGKFHALERNTPGPYPIHGNAFTERWTVREFGATHARLALASEGPGPFRYAAEAAYSLADGALTTRVTVVNRATIRLPFGAGLHPWFVRTPSMRLTMSAAGYWSETADHLPDAYLPTSGDAQFDFASGERLPESFVNNAFTGWDGRARLEWPDRRLAAELIALPPLSTVILYSPSGVADYVCVEPVSHSVDAHNRSDAGSAPPQVLAPGEALVIEATIRPYTL